MNMKSEGMKLVSVLGLGMAFSGGLAACAGGQMTQMVSNPRVPAAEGQVVATKIENGNTRLTLTVKHLAHAASVQGGATIYVVWLQPNEQAPAQNIGALDVDKNLNGTLTTTTTQTEFLLSVTAEPFPNAAAPAGAEVFRTTVRAK